MFVRRKIINCLRGHVESVSQFSVLSNNLKCIIGGHTSISVQYTHNVATQNLKTQQLTLPVNKFTLRSHTCGELRLENVGTNVQLSGWMEFQRMRKFITLRDSYGATQLIIPDERKDLQERIDGVTHESILSIQGTVVRRPNGQENPKMKTGDIEVLVDSLELINAASETLPFFIRGFNKPKESLQMKYRYLSLRYPEMQQNLRLRSTLISKMRQYLIEHCDFVEVETPTLFKSTPGGAQEFVVPSRQPGYYYSLVQSPQQFKQLLMIGGIDRYFQVARCYRDEDVRHDRQLEFTQFDIEMSFTNCEGVMGLIEEILLYSFPKDMGITIPFKRMTYNDAMDLYGTDKPDLRIPYQIQDLTETVGYSDFAKSKIIDSTEEYKVCALHFPKAHDRLTQSVKQQLSDLKRKYFPSTILRCFKISGDQWKLRVNRTLVEDSAEHIQQKLNLSEGDVLFLSIGDKTNVQELLGRLRVEFANILEAEGEKVRLPVNELLWIVDFPLFSYNKEIDHLETTHHPFTQPYPEDIQYLDTEPTKVRSLHYDLVMNGAEIGGGSIRIHNPNLQRKILKILDINESELSHMLEALASGAPPHGGIALGLDRIVSLLCNTQTIRNVIAFPKTMEGRDLISGAPSRISKEIEERYHIRSVDGSSAT